MSRVQLALRVSDLEGSIAFYRSLFGAEPAERRPGYANFGVVEPPLKLVLIEREPDDDRWPQVRNLPAPRRPLPPRRRVSRRDPLHQPPGPSPLPDQANLGVLLIGDMPEAQRHEHARRCVRAGQRVRDDMVNLATRDSEFDQRTSRSGAETRARAVTDVVRHRSSPMS